MQAQTEESLVSGYPARILYTITAGGLVISMVGLVVPPLLPEISRDLGLSSSQAGSLMTVWWVTIALTNIVGGRVADVLSHKTGLVLGMSISILGAMALTQANRYLLLLLGIAVVAAGRGVYQPSAIAQIADLFVRKRGSALGLRGAAFNLGGVIAGGLAALVLAYATWQASFVPMVVAAGVVLIMHHAWNRQPYALGRVRVDVLGTLTRLRRTEHMGLVIASLALFGFVWNGSLSFLPAYLQAGKGFSPSLASLTFSGVFVTGVLVQPVYGLVGDRFGHPVAAFVAVAITAVGLVGLVGASRPVAVVVSVAVFAFGLAAFWPVVLAFGLEQLSSSSRAGDWGVVTGIFLSIEGSGSLYVGAAIDLTGYPTAFASLLVCLVGAMAITLWLSLVE